MHADPPDHPALRPFRNHLRVLSRRDMLHVLGGATAALVAGCGWPRSTEAGSSVPACVVRPEQMEGPYFVDERLHRADIRSDTLDGSVRAGVALELGLRVVRVDRRACRPIPGAMVDVWHCDAQGVYSDVADINGRFDTRGRTFLRGYQLTDGDGHVRFTTIYPGWYEGRTVHIHFKVRSNPAGGQGHEFTSQLYVDDAVTERVHAQVPYATKGRGRIQNMQDGLFRHGGDRLMLALTPAADGYAGVFEIGLSLA